MKEYFPHDYYARDDQRIVRLLSKIGWEGYGLFWAIIEKLYENNGSLEKDYESIAFDLRTQYERITDVVESYDLFYIENEKIYSRSVLGRLKIREEKSEKARKSVMNRWNNTNVIRTQYERNTIKEKKRKEKKSISISHSDKSPDEINLLIEKFKDINPSYQTLFRNKTERRAAGELIKQYGLPKMLEGVDILINIISKPYAPKITTPYQLQRDMGKLKAYIEQDNNSSKKRETISI